LGQASSISSDGSTIAAAAPQANGFGGAVDVFVKGASGWVNATQTAELTYAAGDGLLFLGNSVDVSSDGRTVVAGGNGRALIFPEPFRIFCLPNCITVYGWRNVSESAQLTASDGAPIAWTRISGDGTLVAAAGVQSSPGAIYLFGKPNNG